MLPCRWSDSNIGRTIRWRSKLILRCCMNMGTFQILGLQLPESSRIATFGWEILGVGVVWSKYLKGDEMEDMEQTYFPLLYKYGSFPDSGFSTLWILRNGHVWLGDSGSWSPHIPPQGTLVHRQGTKSENWKPRKNKNRTTLVSWNRFLEKTADSFVSGF